MNITIIMIFASFILADDGDKINQPQSEVIDNDAVNQWFADPEKKEIKIEANDTGIQWYDYRIGNWRNGYFAGVSLQESICNFSILYSPDLPDQIFSSNEYKVIVEGYLSNGMYTIKFNRIDGKGTDNQMTIFRVRESIFQSLERGFQVQETAKIILPETKINRGLPAPKIDFHSPPPIIIKRTYPQESVVG